ncbi:MAG TPA: hypothetical protein VK066_12185 [Chloroflexota bacterium]|nr:hypothetical protein [Chloroflexota bacterium]
MRLRSAILAALMLGSAVPALSAQPARAQTDPQMAQLCDALDAWVSDPEGAVDATLIMIGHNQGDEGTTWAREHAQRLVNNAVFDYVRSRAEKDLNLTDAENELTDSISSTVQGPEDEQEAARERLGHPLSIDLPAFLARAVPSCATAGTPITGE